MAAQNQAGTGRFRREAAPIPERLGRYEIVERLASGGMGEVFVARFIAPGGFIKPVAVKRIHPHLASDETFIHMLHDEANVAAAIRHPNIIATIDVGADGDDHFVVVEYVSGDPLSRIVRDLRHKNMTMPPWVVAWVGAQIASALHAAHEARALNGERLDIVHRDVSLANILLSDAGHPMLFDFGVAKAKQRLVQTSAGELKGKLAYMAPETFHGAPVNRSVDIFALGVVLYELLTNISPFQRDSDLEIIGALQCAPIEPPSRAVPSIDPALDPIVLTAMARERDDRYRTAAEIEHDLRAWARMSLAKHDAASVAAWVAATFPDRQEARAALLSRIANPPPRPAAAGTGQVESATGGALGAGATPAHGSGIAAGDLGGMARLTTSARIAQQGGIGAEGAPGRKKTWLGIAGAAGALVTGSVLAIALFGGSSKQDAQSGQSEASTASTAASSATAAATPSDRAASATSAGTGAQAAPAEDVVAAAAASASASAMAAAAGAQPAPPAAVTSTAAAATPGTAPKPAAPRGPAPRPTGKSRGPLVRSYD
jgi:serine/threonine-protein kinase